MRRHRQRRQAKRQDDADQVTLEQHHQRDPHLAQQLATEQAVVQRVSGLQEARQQQVVVLKLRNGFPEHGEQHQDQAFTQPALLPQALPKGQFTLQRHAGQWLQNRFERFTRG
ncbi:hypothetical protein D3C84_713580 [compost metagenome]